MKRTVVIVGSGVAGAIVAKQLLERSPSTERVIVLEAGTPVPQMDRRKWMDYVTTWKLPYDPNKDIREDYDLASGKIAFEGGRLFARGGSTMHWGGWAFRYKPEDFRTRSNVEREIDWAFGYDDLERYYWQAEQFLGVAGDSAADDPPRHGRAYPYAPPPMVAGDAGVKASLERLGLSYTHFPVARFADRCVTTGTCRYCPVGGRYSATQTLDELERIHGPAGRFEIRTGAAVQSVISDGAHGARGVVYRDAEAGRTTLLEADVVVLCAGALETPKIMLASATPAWPAGLGNQSGHVGWHFKIHPMLYVDAQMERNPGGVLQELDFPTIACRHYDTAREQRDGKLFFSRTSRFPQLDIEGMMARGEAPAQIERAVSGPATVTLSGFIEEFASEESGLQLSGGSTRFGVPRTSLAYAPVDNRQAVERHLANMSAVLEVAGAKVVKKGVYELRIDHATSTTRMSADPAQGVVDADLRVHGVDNVFVCSTSVFPTISAVPPTLTLAAVALRLGDYLVESIA